MILVNLLPMYYTIMVIEYLTLLNVGFIHKYHTVQSWTFIEELQPDGKVVLFAAENQ